MKIWIKILVILNTMWLVSSVVSAQSLKSSIWRDNLNSSVGNTFTNRLTIANTDSQTQVIKFALQVDPSIQFLSGIPDSLVLIPGEVAMIPLKGFVNRQPDSLVSQIIIRISTRAGLLLQQKSFRIVVEEKAQATVTLYTPDEKVVLYSISEPARLPLHIVHNRSRREKLLIEVASYPEGIDRSGFPLLLELAPRQDTVLSLSLNPMRYWSASMPYQLTVTVRDSTGSVLGNVLYQLSIATTSKRFNSLDSNPLGGYGVSAAVTKLSNNQWAREGRIWGRDSVGRSQVDFQIHYLDYVSANFQQLQNSYISVRNDRGMVHLGSLYDYHEMPLLGRGLKVNVARPDHQWTFWAVNSNPNWLNPTANTWAGRILSARYDQDIPNSPGSSWSVSSSYFTQSATMRAGFLNFGSVQFHRSKRHSLELLGGQSVEYARLGPNRAQTIGWAGQLNYSFHSTDFAWNLRSYISSPVYAGLQKGATLIQSQTVWRPSESTTLIARLNHVRYNQIWFSSSVDRYQRLFGNSVAEVSLTQYLKSFTIGLRPFYSVQTDFSNPYAQKAASYRLSPSLSYQRGPKRRIDLAYDIGTFQNRSVPMDRQRFLSQRMIASWTLGPFSLWGYWQKGPYYLSDLRTDQPTRYRIASITPMIDFTLLNRRMVGSVGLNYIYDALSSGSRYLAVGRVRYDITPDLWLRAEGNATPYSQQADLAYSQYRLELTKRFSQFKVNRRGQLRLSFFEDINGDGQKDSGENWIDSLLVTINENTLLTNPKGTIAYRNLPPGTYTVSAVSISQVGDPIQYSEKITVGRSVNRQIPLRRSFRVKGQLRCQTNTYDHQPCQFDRFTLDIQQNQKTVFTHSPLPDGGFVFHLPPGKYTLLLHDYARQPQTTVQTIPFELSTTGQHPEFTLAVEASVRAVEVKRFGMK